MMLSSLESMGAVKCVEFPTASCFRPDDDDEEYIRSKNFQKGSKWDHHPYSSFILNHDYDYYIFFQLLQMKQLIVPPEHLDRPVFPPSQPETNSPSPCGLVSGLQMSARARAKRLAAQDASDLV